MSIWVVFLACFLVQTNASVGYVSLGCYGDSTNPRALTSEEYLDYDFSNDPNTCAKFCGTYPYFGLQYGYQCFCGDNLEQAMQYGSSSACSFECYGNLNYECGGYYANNLYAKGYSYVGCFIDNPSSRTLPYQSPVTASSMTIKVCSAACNGYAYFAVQDGDQCFCGNSLPDALQYGISTGCTMSCAGNSNENCGGVDANAVFSRGFTYQGCYYDSSEERAFPYLALSSDSGLTLENCFLLCLATGYSYFAAQDGNQCFCGNSLELSMLYGTSSGCTTECAGNSLEMCGGSYANSVYSIRSTYVGCYADNTNSRALYYEESNSQVTIDYCADLCQVLGYAYFGVQDGDQCFCSDSLTKATEYDPSSACTMACEGNSNQNCGGASANAIYSVCPFGYYGISCDFYLCKMSAKERGSKRVSEVSDDGVFKKPKMIIDHKGKQKAPAAANLREDETEDNGMAEEELQYLRATSGRRSGSYEEENGENADDGNGFTGPYPPTNDDEEQEEEEEEENEQDKISKIVDSAEQSDIPAMDSHELRKMVARLERAIDKNSQTRIKYADQPEKFVNSEVDLDEEIKKFHALAATPNLYAEFVSSGCIEKFTNLLSHENPDISNDVVDVLRELTDADNNLQDEDAETLLKALLDNLILELVVINLKRLNEEVQEEAQGVFNSLALIENITEIDPQISEQLVAKTAFYEWTLARLKQPTFDNNKQYTSEILAISLQNSQANRLKLGELQGLDVLLTAIAGYRKRDPSSPDEIEYLENLFDSVCSCLLEAQNKQRFLEAEGIELMLILVKEKIFSRKGAVKVLSYALSGDEGEQNANRFVEVLGLKTIFATFMKKGSKSMKKAYKENYSDTEEEERILSIISSLLQNVQGESRLRLLAKFVEENYEKTDRLMDLYFSYSTRVRNTDAEIDEEKRKLIENEEEINDDEFYLKRLDGGLFVLQIVDLILLYICTCEEDSFIREHVMKVLKVKGGKISDIAEVMTEYANNLAETEAEEIREKKRNHVRKMIELFQQV